LKITDKTAGFTGFHILIHDLSGIGYRFPCSFTFC